MLSMNFYTFKKNMNSTKQPGTPAETLQIALIEPTSIVNPSISLIHQNPTDYNYAYIPEFKRYYFVNDWVFSGNRWIARCSCDVLASWKTDIGNSTQYVVRSSAAYDTNIIDVLYPAKSKPTVVETEGEDGLGNANPFKTKYEDGAYIVGIINGDDASNGAVAYYAFTPKAFRNFCNYMLENVDWVANSGELTDLVTQPILKAIFNPFQYITTCFWIPYPIGGSDHTIKYGWWSLNGGGSVISLNSLYNTMTFKIPKHPQQSRGNYLNHPPFSSYHFSWPVFGEFDLPGDIVGSCENLWMRIEVSPTTGNGILRIFGEKTDGTLTLITTITAQVGIPVPMANSYSDWLKAGTEMLSSAIGIAGAVAGVLTGTAFSTGSGSVGDAIQAAAPKISHIGGAGDICKFSFNPTLQCEFHLVTDDNPQHFGKPLMQNQEINNLSGFILCHDTEIELPATSGEISEIKKYMNDGFFYE